VALPDKYEVIVSRAAIRAGAAGIPGSAFPPLDIGAMLWLWTQMIVDIAKASGHPVNRYFAAKLVYSLSASSLLYYTGSRIFTSALHIIPGAGTITAAGTNAALNYAYTRNLGARLVAQFERPDLDLKSVARMAASIGSIFVGASVADDLIHTHTALDAATSVDLAHGISSNLDLGIDMSAGANLLHDPVFVDAGSSIDLTHGLGVSAGVDTVAHHDAPLFGYTAPGVHYNSTSDMIAGRGYNKVGEAVTSLGYRRKT
jgi:uncharacterized protein (DUF697 family)